MEPDIQELLLRSGRGDAEAARALAAFVYHDLRRIARGLMRGERGDHTLQPTALANEACLRLLGSKDLVSSSRQEYFAAAVATLRRILVEHARARGRLKRGGAHAKVDLAEVEPSADPDVGGVIEIDELLAQLAHVDPIKARVVELRFFAGLSVAETAAVLGVSERTAARAWRTARAYLRTALGAEPDDDALDERTDPHRDPAV